MAKKLLPEGCVNQALRAARGDRSHAEMAAFLGIGRSTYTKLENGWGVSLAMAKKICNKLGLTMDAVWGDSSHNQLAG